MQQPMHRRAGNNILKCLLYIIKHSLSIFILRSAVQYHSSIARYDAAVAAVVLYRLAVESAVDG